MIQLRRCKQAAAIGSSSRGALLVLAAICLVIHFPGRFGNHLKFNPKFQLPNSGADFHNCVDGNFHHRHIKAAGQCPKFFDPEYMLRKEFVDSIGARIEAARKSRPKVYQPLVPDEAVNECEESHEAADIKKQKATMERFDDTGLMFLVCRHDIPLFCANIDSPGEHQKYAIALLEHFFSLIPPHATVAPFYDIGCVLDRSLSLVSVLAIICDRTQPKR